MENVRYFAHFSERDKCFRIESREYSVNGKLVKNFSYSCLKDKGLETCWGFEHNGPGFGYDEASLTIHEALLKAQGKEKLKLHVKMQKLLKEIEVLNSECGKIDKTLIIKEKE